MKDIIKQWWFWGIIAIILILIFINIVLTNKNDMGKVYDKEVSKENIINNTNLYKTMNDYDGKYIFELNGNNGFNSKGVIVLDKGTCKAKYLIINNEGNLEIIERSGFCGISNEDDTTYCISFKYDMEYGFIGYKCIQEEKGLKCDLNSQYDLIGQSNSNLNLQRLDTNKDLNDIFIEIKADIEQEEKAKKEQEEMEKKAEEEKKFKESCKTYTYEQIARNPEKFKGTNIKLTGEVIQALYSSSTVDLRVNITKQGTYSTYYTDTVYVVYYPETGEDKILEDDIITFYGTAQGDYTYTSAIGTPVTLPLIYGRYIEIN